ncbi:MAG: SDR family oxidoreductase [Hassallia sp. WJT32-NPBG1]|jgi:acyl transferase domain-containing protein|nr:SDR family oxidoreductase [Hassallia sp. WJT32-NPBG1]
MSHLEMQDSLEGIAIIGMSGRFPKAKNIDEFWQNIQGGVEAISFFSETELESLGIDRTVLKNPNFVKAGGVLEEIEQFDASFFGFSPREAEIMDPQYRLFLEQVWEALESAGYNSQTYAGAIGIYGGMSMSQYLLNNLLPNRDLLNTVSPLQLRILNDKDFLTSLIAYKLNLKGPSITVQTACSTSLVAVHLACQSLLNYQCDIAVAGGVSITVPHKSGYLAQEGVYSPDGHCKAFDANAQGTVAGNGVGVVVLKRLADALADGDYIHAVIKGSAINNDGSVKVGYTAPSVDGQAEAIAMAQAIAGVEPDTISYIEAHGTGTPLGDPIEIAALTQVFRTSTENKGFCAVGSVKTNIGHLDAAAGVASLIKTVMALKHKLLPPSLHFQQPNPQIDFAQTPFYVNAQLTEWKADNTPRRAGVSAFSVGGVNAHIVVEEMPMLAESGASRPWQLLVLSAKTDSALEAATDNLVDYLKQHPEVNLADVAYTYQIGRRGFNHRRVLVCRDLNDAVSALATRDPKRILTGISTTSDRSIVFMFPGLGNHYVNMAEELYQVEPVFREQIDHCCEILKPHLGIDLRDVLYPNKQADIATPSQGLDLRKMLNRNPEAADVTTEKLNQTYLTQPALFVIEYALAQLWMAWGVRPQAMIGYSIGECVAATLAGVLSLEDALYLVAKRAQMIQALPGGAMLAVPLPEQEIQPLLGEKLSISAINGPSVCVVSGATDAIAALETQLVARGLACRRLQTSHAFHSKMMEPLFDSFIKLVQNIPLQAPEIPYVSNVTGTWITAAQATDPTYWAKHLCQTVCFADGIAELYKQPGRILLEVGPGQALGSWALQHPASENYAERLVLPSLRHSYDRQADTAFLLNTLGKLWLAGIAVDWSAYYANEQRYRLPLPTYPFERQRYWIEAQKQLEDDNTSLESLEKKADIADWFYIPVWKQSLPLGVYESGVPAEQKHCWLVFVDECGVGSQIVEKLETEGEDVFTVKIGEQFSRDSDRIWCINPENSDDYNALIQELRGLDKTPTKIVHLWNVTSKDSQLGEIEFFQKCQNLGFYSLLFLAQALGNQNIKNPLHIGIISNNIQTVTGEEELHPEKATLLGPCKVIPQEYSNITCTNVDIVVQQSGTWQTQKLIDQLLAELTTKSAEEIVAFRGNHRWVQTFEPMRLDEVPQEKTRLRQGGVYLITGGLGGIGLVLAEYLAQTVQPKLVLIGRSPFPNQEEWGQWLVTHGDRDEVSRKIRKLQMLEKFGAEVLVASADVTNKEQMQQVVSKTYERFGEIHGVLHAAGVAPGGMMQLKTPESVAKVLAPKVKGTLVLNEIFQDVKLDFFALCSSLNAIIGAFGLVDHCAANAFLDTFANSNAVKSQQFILSINWDAWLEVGQAANAAASYGLKDAPQIFDDKEILHPLLDRCILETSEQKIYSSKFSPEKQWILDEHKLMGNGLVPGTAYLEMIRAAFAQSANTETVAIQKIVFLNPLIVKNGETKEVHTILKQKGNSFEFLIVSQNNASEWQEHVKGIVADIAEETPIKYELAEIFQECSQKQVSFTEQEGTDLNDALAQVWSKEELSSYLITTQAQATYVTFGQRWQNLLKQLHVGQNEVIALLELPKQFAADLEEFQIHPSLMDAATGLAQIIGKGFYLPLAYEKLTIKAPLARRIYSYVTFKADDCSQTETIACDILIMNEEGFPLIEIEGYTLKKINHVPTLDAFKETELHQTQSATIENEDTNKNSSPSNNILQILLEGILPQEGVIAFSRLLSKDLTLPQVTVSTKDIRSLIAQINTFTKSRFLQEVEQLKFHRPIYPRPNVQTLYVAPTNELETSLANIWQKMFNLAEIGIYDNFFEIGGDSLLATQLISRLSETFHVDLPLRALFESPTVAELAVVIAQKQLERADTETSLTGFQDWSPLVKIQPYGSQRPFFCVHPADGNIFCYVELAQLLGTNRPFYGLQASGIDGKRQPYTQIADMANHYIEALRTVQPQGPYLLGGWSLGGVVAFEMAQQLQQQGEQVALLALLDSWVPNFNNKSPGYDDVELLAQFAWDLGSMFGKDLSGLYDNLRQLPADEQLNYVFEQLRLLKLVSLDTRIQQVRDRLEVYKSNVRAAHSYLPQVYPQGMTLFEAKEQMLVENGDNPTSGWKDLAAQGVEIYTIPGNHYTILRKPHIQDLAEKLKACLDAIA